MLNKPRTNKVERNSECARTRPALGEETFYISLHKRKLKGSVRVHGL